MCIFLSASLGLVGTIFLEKYEEAFAGLRIAQGLGVAILFGYSNSFCMKFKVYVMLAALIFSLTSYLVMEVNLKLKENRKVMVLKIREATV